MYFKLLEGCIYLFMYLFIANLYLYVSTLYYPNGPFVLYDENKYLDY